MSVFSWASSLATLSTTNDTMTLTPASARVDWIIEVSVGGMGTSSVASELDVFNVTAVGTTGSSAITAVKFSPNSNGAGSTVNAGWTTQPTVGQPYITLPVNANGGIYRWVARPGEEINLLGGAATGAQASFRSKVGSSQITVHAVVVEDPY